MSHDSPLVMEYVRLSGKVTDLQSALNRVLELHQQDDEYCSHCESKGGGYSGGYRVTWPCPTIDAIGPWVV